MELIKTTLYREKVPRPEGDQMFGKPRDDGARKHEGTDFAGFKWQGGYNPKDFSAGVFRKAQYNNIGGNAGYIYHDNGDITFVSHCAGFVVKDGQRVNPDQMWYQMGDSGNASGVNAHVQFKRKGGSWIDITPLVEVKEAAPVIDPRIAKLELELISAKNLAAKQLDEEKAKSQIIIEKNLEIIKAKTEENEQLKREIDEAEKALQIQLNPALAEIINNIIEESVEVDNLLSRWGKWVDNKFPKSNTLRSILKYEIFVGIGWLISLGSIKLILPDAPDSIVLLVSFFQGQLFKLLVTRYDTNKDGKLNLDDSILLKP